MATVEQMIAEFAEELRTSGEADPNKYLRQVERADRRELAALIDATIERAPRRSWDAAAFEGSLAQRAAERISPGLEADEESLPELLPRLRTERKIPRDELVGRLAELLGVGSKERKVGRYYNQLEQGNLSAEEVSWSVFDALGQILGESVTRLRASSWQSFDAPGGQASPAFARHATPAPGFPVEDADRIGASGPADDEWDEVDQLFRGGERGVSD